MHRIFKNGIVALITELPSFFIIGAGDGSLARVNKKTMKVE